MFLSYCTINNYNETQEKIFKQKELILMVSSFIIFYKICNKIQKIVSYYIEGGKANAEYRRNI